MNAVVEASLEKGDTLAWQQRNRSRCYYRTKRVGRRFVNQYFGSGPLAQVAAAEDEHRRIQRQNRSTARKNNDLHWVDLESPLVNAFDQSNLFSTATFLAEGFHQHDSSDWKRKHHA
jgi:hypothetical protein